MTRLLPESAEKSCRVHPVIFPATLHQGRLWYWGDIWVAWWVVWWWPWWAITSGMFPRLLWDNIVNQMYQPWEGSGRENAFRNCLALIISALQPENATESLILVLKPSVQTDCQNFIDIHLELGDSIPRYDFVFHIGWKGIFPYLNIAQWFNVRKWGLQSGHWSHHKTQETKSKGNTAHRIQLLFNWNAITKLPIKEP